jgi:hypothetical protein
MPPTTSALATTSPPAFALSVQSVDDLARLARVFAASGLFGRGQNPEQLTAECAIRLMAGLEAGFSPFASATGVHIIEGKPAFSSNLLAQAVRRHPAYDYRVLENSATVCRIQFLSGGQPLGISTWTIEMAERAGLAGKTNWKRYPEAQLFARAMSAGVRTHCPDALGGATAYVPEELGAAEPTMPVTVTELPAPEPDTAQLVGRATIACRDAGLTSDGLMAFCSELSNGEGVSLQALPPETLARLVRSGVSAETVARCNAAGEAMTTAADDELPAAWDQSESESAPSDV